LLSSIVTSHLYYNSRASRNQGQDKDLFYLCLALDCLYVKRSSMPHHSTTSADAHR
jgi:hypothetical protein